jgi:hypothetical protein
MIQILNVEVNWISATQCGKCEMVYGGMLVNYFDGEVRDYVRLDIPENVAMNLTLNDIRERVVLKLKGVQR